MNLSKFNNIDSGDLYSLIKKRQKDNERCDIPFWEPQTFENRFPGVTVTYFEKDYISNVIGRRQLARLDYRTILTIVAQTGSGKTTWLFKSLAPWILEQKSNKKILYLCNRISLADQIKQIAMKDEVNGNLYAGDCCVKEKKDYFSAKGLQSEYDFGMFHIMTYQSYLTKYKKLNLNDYEFVIYDEGHWILNESTYNPYTEEILLMLNEHFMNTKKIILTATPQHSLDVIWNSLYNSTQEPYNKPRMQIFYAKEDYSYVYAKFFAEMESIINEIEFREKGYWLIFVKSKKIGKDLETILSNKGIECSFITADTDKGDEDYRNLIADEKLPKKVLLTTKVLNVGVNVKNSFMNIVVTDLEISEMKQMIGRKRIKENETINVYFYTPSIQELSKRANSIKQKLAEVNTKLHSIKAQEFIEQLEHPFYYHGAEVKINSLCLHKLKLESHYYDKLISYLKTYDDFLEQSKAYAMYLLEEFEGINYREEDLFVTNSQEKLDNLLTEYEEQEMTKEQFNEFSVKLTEITGDPRTRPRAENPKKNSIDPFLAKYGYAVQSEGHPTKYKLVKKEDE